MEYAEGGDLAQKIKEQKALKQRQKSKRDY